MPVISSNSNIYPKNITGAMIQVYPEPKVIRGNAAVPNPQGGVIPALGTMVPDQVIGLVPLFKCCNSVDAVGGFTFGSFNTLACAGDVTLSLTINNVLYGTFTYNYSSSNSSIQNAINSLLSGTGFFCTVTGTPILRYCKINSPTDSGDFYNGYQILVFDVGEGCGGVVKTMNFSGGISRNPCDPDCDCREYGADSITDDRNFTLSVFASTDCSDLYHNDFNTWIIKYPGTYNAISAGDFKLQKLINGTWNTAATLNNSTYGTVYANNFLASGTCQNTNYCGVELLWQRVLENQGEGTYRLYVSGTIYSRDYCLYSPPFCLKTFDCIATDGTMKFEANYSGGNFGSVTTQGDSWSLCCTQTSTNGGQTLITSTPIKLRDSIRFFGFFGREGYEYQRDSIKYATGEIKKVRDETIKVFDCETSQMPMWFHQRLASYGFMADQLFVSDYNINNDSYQYKRFWVVADSEYKPIHKGSTRYPKTRQLRFKEGLQYVFRDRCCSGNKVINIVINPPPPPVTPKRVWSNLDGHKWANGTNSKFA